MASTFPITYQLTQSKQTIVNRETAGQYNIRAINVNLPTGGAFTAKLKLNDNGVETVLWNFSDLEDGDNIVDTTSYQITNGVSLVLEGTIGLNVSIFGQ